MANQLTVPILRSPTFEFGDRIELEVNSQVQPDKLPVWGSDRQTQGFGHGPFGGARMGRSYSPGFGRGPFGLGVFGMGVALIFFRTTTAFPAGDYSVRARAHDKLGNVGTWSAAATVPHRPAPAGPKALTIDPVAGTLCWTWGQDDG